MLSENDLAGKDFDGYHMAAELESSASSRIFLGESISSATSDKRVIIKLLHVVDDNMQKKQERVPQAITAVQQLQHPHILPILSAGIYKDFPYVITEYAAAGSLDDRLQGRSSGQPMQQEEALSMLAQIGQALQYAHEKQIIHGRLKPQNVLFDVDGNVLVADFYTHYFLLPDRSEHHNPTGASIYLAPEQLAGHSREKSDQYALGCLAYEMLTGSKAFMIPSINTPGTYYRTRSLIAPGRINPDLPSYIEKAILKAMSKDPDQRYPNVAAFLMALGILPPDSSYQQEEVETVLAQIETMAPGLPVTPVPASVTFGAEITRNVTAPEEYDSTALNDRVPALHIARLFEPQARVSSISPRPYAISRNLPFKTTWGRLTLTQRRMLAVLLCLVVIVLVAGVLFVPSSLPTSPKAWETTSPTYTTIPAHAPTQAVSPATVIPAGSTSGSMPGTTASAQNTALAQGTVLSSSKGSSQSSGSSSQNSNANSTATSAPTRTVAPIPTPKAAPTPTPTTVPTPTPIPTPASTLTQVALSAFFNNKGIGSVPGEASFDGSGYAYPASQLPAGGSITVNGVPYQFPSSSSGDDNVIAAGQAIGLAVGHYRQANLLVAASWGPVTGTITIEYSDGSTSSASVSVADWLAGPANGLQSPYRYGPNTIYQNTVYIYAITIAMDSTRTARTLVLPGQVSGQYQTGRLHVFALTVVP